ncbi:MAG TPA: DUF1990 domain-containing protein [Pirellulales bacterium]|nr:DUF1990 domain-containing protein [Pirellulales bacterium]
MTTFNQPSVETIRRFLAEQAELPFTYSAVGATAKEPPSGYKLDRTRIQLGTGEVVFNRAKAALERWDHFHVGWIDVWPRAAAIRQGEVVVVVGRLVGLWWLNSARIVYVVDELGPVRRFGFAYGTLPGHAECGEERFLVEWDQRDDSVWYEILAFSRPNKLVAWLGLPLVRRAQKRFARDSAAAMRRAADSAQGQPDSSG